jgi:hypothetical protein|tara:strand:- start:2 stop:376 length:375 start_codon:yes stop_codon:yes gene_type:complete
MKKIKIKKLVDDTTYVDMFKLVLQSPLVKEGRAVPLTTPQIMEFFPIIEKLEEVKVPEIGQGSILLEDAQYKAILDRVNDWGWGAGTKDLYYFIKDLQDAEDTEDTEDTEVKEVPEVKKKEVVG